MSGKSVHRYSDKKNAYQITGSVYWKKQVYLINWLPLHLRQITKP
jgi:hypothetical protein